MGRGGMVEGEGNEEEESAGDEETIARGLGEALTKFVKQHLGCFSGQSEQWDIGYGCMESDDNSIASRARRARSTQILYIVPLKVEGEIG